MIDQLAQRIAWLERRMVRQPGAIQASEVRIDLGAMARFRIFRDPLRPREWRLVHHRPMESQVMRGMGFLFVIDGQTDHSGGRLTRRYEALRWIAIRWDDVIDRLMRDEG